MDAIQGVGGTDSEVRPLSRVAGEAGKPRSGSAQDQPEEAQGTAAALTLSREYVSSALRECGFVDICAGSLAGTGDAAKNEPSGAQAGQTELDVGTVGEVAAHFGQQVAASSIDAILEIVSHPDPKYALKLLT